jgi:carbon monoxide dehydrogenase subunit G
MLVDLNRTLTLNARQQDAWVLLRDTKRLAGLLPGVQSITSEGPVSSHAAAEAPVERHLADVAEKVGPFQLNLKLAITISRVIEHSLIEAELKGADARIQNRVSGTLRAELKPIAPAETVLRVDAAVEVVGKLASLGAAPIKKRANELFDQFTERLQSEFSAAETAEAAEEGSAV